jgi:hypothetical protein
VSFPEKDVHLMELYPVRLLSFDSSYFNRGSIIITCGVKEMQLHNYTSIFGVEELSLHKFQRCTMDT